MNYDEFIGQVQHRARLATREEAVRAIRATLSTFARRLYGGEPKDIASQLPTEIAIFMKGGGEGERFHLREFYQRVSEIENVDPPDAVFHARAVISVLIQALSPGEVEDIRAQLDPEWETLFEQAESLHIPE